MTPLFQVQIDLDASDALEAAATISGALQNIDAMPCHLREKVERFASAQAQTHEDQDGPALIGGVDHGVAVVRCNPALLALVGSLRAQGVG